jgi:site-specific recombinase XerD
MLKAYQKYLIDLKHGDGLAVYRAESINANNRILRSFFIYLSDKGLCMGVLSGITNLKYSESLSRNILTRKEISKLFHTEVCNVVGFMIKTIFVCLYATGLRISELLGLKIKDIDFDNNVLLIYESKERKERYVHIAEVGINYLKIYLSMVRDKIGYDFKSSDKVFISIYEGKPLRETTINAYLKKCCKSLDIKKNISTHCFRHSYGTHLLENGAEIKHISELLGHKKIETTERYTRLNPQNLREVINTCHPREVEVSEWD